MDWTIDEGYGIPIGIHCHMSYPKEVSLVSFPLHLSVFTRKPLSRRLPYAYPSGAWAWSTIRTIFVRCCRTWAFLIRKPVVCQTLSMRPSASHGVRPGGRRFYGRPGSEKRCSSVAMKPALPSGVRCATRARPGASNPKCLPVARARPTRSAGSSTIAPDGFSSQPTRGSVTAIRLHCAPLWWRRVSFRT
jgi:hypothetical protein